MLHEVPPIFRGEVEIDETYLGGAWKNKRRSQRERGRGTSKAPVFGILCRGSQVWARVVPNVETRTLWPLIRGHVQRGSTIYSDTWKSYTGIATKGYVHRLVHHGKGEYGSGTNHINGLEGFWGYLKRRLAAKGGIRRDRLPLYLAEYVWRFNHRRFTRDQQVQQLMKLPKQTFHLGG
jgi:transposase